MPGAAPVESAATENLLVRREGAVAVLTFNRPDVLNAMTQQMSADYAHALRVADADPEVRVVVVTGEGRGFCAGADTRTLSEGAEAIRSFLPAREDLPTVAFRIRKPVVAAVNGPVAGIGFAYLMASDVRFVAAEAKIATTFARLGLAAEYGLSWLLPRAIGTGWAMDLLLTGRVITGEEAGRIGIAQYVRPLETLLADAIAYASDLAETSSPWSMARAKEQVYADLELGSDEALTRALKFMDESFDGHDLGEALAARGDKRAPVFDAL